MKKIFLIVLLVFVLLLSACKGDEASEQESVPAAEEASEQEEPTGEEQPAAEEPAPTPEPALYGSNFESTLSRYLLRPDDLPNEYKIPAGMENHNTTLRLIQEWGEMEAKTYVDATGRIDGWFLHMERRNKEDFVPIDFESTVELFKTPEGAQTAMGPDWFRAYNDETGDVQFVEGGCDLGDQCIVYTWQTIDPETDLVKVRYEVAFTYRNVMFWVLGRGLEIDVKPEYMMAAAQTAFDKIAAAAP